MAWFMALWHLVFVALLWGIPRLVDMAKFYDYFINTIIVTVGTVVVSICIGCFGRLFAGTLCRHGQCCGSDRRPGLPGAAAFGLHLALLLDWQLPPICSTPIFWSS